VKTIKQIADVIGVTKQAVFYRMRKLPLSNALHSLTLKDNGVLEVLAIYFFTQLFRYNINYSFL